MSNTHVPQRYTSLELPEHAGILGMSVRAAERVIEEARPGQGLLDLTGADTHCFPPPDWVLSDFAEAASGGGPTYTPARGDGAVREAVAANLTRFLAVPVDPERRLILTPGTQAALFTAISALVEPGDLVVLPDPDYMLTERICRFFGATVERVSLTLTDDGYADLDLDRLEELMRRRPRMFVFSNPNNPSGAVYSPGLIKQIAELAETYGVFVLADELYSRLVYDGRTATHIVDDERVRDSSLTLLGPSKTESLSGYRVGTAVGPDWMIDRMSDVLYVSAIRCPAYAQHTLKRWMSEDLDFVARRVAVYQELRDAAVSGLNSIPGITVPTPGGTSYVFPSFRELGVSDVEFCRLLKEEAGLVVNPGFQFGMNSSGHIRICFAQDPAALNDALARIGALVERISGR